MAKLVLVVEDNAVNVRLFRMLLEKNGYRVELAGTAEEGLEKARSLAPQGIIMDLQLPGDLDGVEATRRLKRSPETSGIPILVVTAHAFADIREAAEKAGCDGFLTKPYGARGFLETVASVFGAPGDA